MKAEQTLTELVQRLRKAAGSNLLSVVLYGSAASEEFHKGHSDLNVLAVMHDLGSADLNKLSEPVAWWTKQGHPAPLFLTVGELHQAADIFAIEFVDIQAAHRLLHGEDVITTLRVPMNLHRLQVERELRNNTLRLRQHYLRHPTDASKTLELMTSSISTFTALFRHALIALGRTPPLSKRVAIEDLAGLLGFDPTPFDQILAIREGQKQPPEFDAQATFASYLNQVAKVTEEVDRRLAPTVPQ